MNEYMNLYTLIPPLGLFETLLQLSNMLFVREYLRLLEQDFDFNPHFLFS